MVHISQLPKPPGLGDRTLENTYLGTADADPAKLKQEL